MSVTDNRVDTTTSADDRRSSSTCPAKRKLDDYASADPDGVEATEFGAASVTARTRIAESEAVDRSPADSAMAASSSSSRLSSPSNRDVPRAPPLQFTFFVKALTGSKSMVIKATSRDTVESVHEKIHELTGIPVNRQRFIYRGKQLRWEQSLAECEIGSGSTLHLAGRLISMRHPSAWQMMDEMISVIDRLCKGESVPFAHDLIKTRLSEYLWDTSTDYNKETPEYLQIFESSKAQSALIRLYESPFKGNKWIAEEGIMHFLRKSKTMLPKLSRRLCVPIVLEFCRRLRGVPQNEPLYSCCRNHLGSLLEVVGLSWTFKNLGGVERVISVKEIFPFVSDLADRLSRGLVSNIESAVSLMLLQSDIKNFARFLSPIVAAIREHSGFSCPISLPLPNEDYNDHLRSVEEIGHLYQIFDHMLKTVDLCLARMEEYLDSESSGEGYFFPQRSSQYLAILKELNAIAKLYVGSQERFWAIMRQRNRSVCALILRYVKPSDDYQWLFEHKDITDFELRRHRAMMLFPEVRDDYDEEHEMLIDRSQLLAESFNYVSEAEPESLHGSLFMEFKDEEAIGPGVVREWFYLVCQAIFNQQNALFVACPNDCSRFYPNPASRVDPLHLKYFKFAGRMIALALKHRVQVGVVLDRTFFLQLAGLQVSLEDIQEADPYLYRSCKQILEMDPNFVDADGLGLTFVREFEELGSRKVAELLPGGANLAVDSKNRNEYVNLLVRHQFVSSISEQVSYFAEGFADILSSSRMMRLFFQTLELEDLDFMLRGSAVDISIQDWMAHTEYHGYKGTDHQIVWFWKIVGELTTNQKNELLFFWTSVRHLPVEGFRGLTSCLQICRSSEPATHLPTSHTCFYQLCLPAYPSMSEMRARLLVIVKEHVICSFGTP